MLKHHRPDFAYIQDTSHLLDVFKYVMDLEVPADATEAERDRLNAVKATAVDFIMNLPADAGTVNNAYPLPLELDMPAFVVLGTDPHAAEVVRYWARLHSVDRNGEEAASPEVCQLAMDHAVVLRDYPVSVTPDIERDILVADFLERVAKEGLVDHLAKGGSDEMAPEQVFQEPTISPVTPTRHLFHRKEIIALHRQILEELKIDTSRLVLIGGWEPLQADMPLVADELVYWADIVVHDRMVAANLPPSFGVTAAVDGKRVYGQVRFNYASWKRDDVSHLAACDIYVPAIQF